MRQSVSRPVFTPLNFEVFLPADSPQSPGTWITCFLRSAVPVPLRGAGGGETEE